MKLGTNVDWTICSVRRANSKHNLNFSVSMATGDVSKLPKITILCGFFFFIKTDFKVLQLEIE
jgi:hypothetical protein